MLSTSTNDVMECDNGGCDDNDDTDVEFYSDLMELKRPMIITQRPEEDHSSNENQMERNNSNHHNCCCSSNRSLLMMKKKMSLESIRSYAIQALALTVQDWNTMGQSTDPTVTDSNIFTSTTNTTESLSSPSSCCTNYHPHSDVNSNKIDEDAILQQCVHRVTSLFLVRIVAIVLHRQEQARQPEPQEPQEMINTKQKKSKPIDLSTSGICRQVLIVDNHVDHVDDPEHSPPPWSFLTQNIVQQLEQYIRYILCEYASHTKLPFHNRQHAVTVVTNCNKLIDFILDPNNHEASYDKYNPDTNHKNTPILYHYNDENYTSRRRPVITYGLRNDPLLIFALLFAALIHDVQHEGKLNSQLVLTTTTTTTTTPSPAALLYNDQSIQEMRSLRVAFEELLKDDYTDLRNILFQNYHPNHTTNVDGSSLSAYRYFRNAVISAVLSTDLASPERMAVSRSKWKEAFFSPNRHHPPQIPQQPSNITVSNRNQLLHRRASAASNESKPRIIRPLQSDGRFYHRRGSNYSEMSEITTDEGNETVVITEFALQQLQSSSSYIHVNRRNSVTSEISAGSYQQQQHRRWNLNKGQYPPTSQYRQRRRSSVQSDVSSDGESSEIAVDSVALMYNKQSNHQNFNNYAARNTKDEASVDSIVSDTIDSYVLRTTKAVKMKREDEFTLQSSATNQLDKPLNGNNDIRNDVSASSLEHTMPQRTLSAETDGSTSFVSYPTGSIAVMQKRLEGGPKTRRRATNITASDGNDDDRDGHDANDIVAHSGHDDTNLRNNSRNLKSAQLSNSKQIGEYGHSPFSPPSSDNDDEDDDDDEYEKQRKELYTPPPKQNVKQVFPSTANNNNNAAERIRNYNSTSTGPARMITRRASTGAISRFGSLTDLRIDENHSNNGESLISYNDDDDNDMKLESKNVALPEIPKYRKRLGIRRSMDLSGEAIEFYPKRNSIGNVSINSGNDQTDGTNDIDNDDEADYIKASAIIEALLRMADVGHFYQNWQNMTVWSARMFQERMLAEPNPAKQDEIYTNWFNNQILIIDSYLKPLAVQLDESGVFGEYNGMMLVQNVEEIRRHWMIYGYEWSQKLLHGMKQQS